MKPGLDKLFSDESTKLPKRSFVELSYSQNRHGSKDFCQKNVNFYIPVAKNL